MLVRVRIVQESFVVETSDWPEKGSSESSKVAVILRCCSSVDQSVELVCYVWSVSDHVSL